LYDSPGTNALVVHGSSATLTTANGTLTVNKFGGLTAEDVKGSDDTISETAVDFAVATTGNWTSV
jgi:hypothetical protein